jgi:hypothetical protein
MDAGPWLRPLAPGRWPPRRCLLAAQLVVAQQALRHLEKGWRVAAVVQGPAYSPVGELLGGNVVPGPQIGRVDLQRLGQAIDDALEHEEVLDPTIGPVGRHGALVGQDADGLDPRIAKRIGASHIVHALHGAKGLVQADVGALVVDQPHPHAQDGAVPPPSHLDVADAPGAVVGCPQVLEAVLGPLDRAADFPRQHGQEHRALVHPRLHAEVAAHVWDDEANIAVAKPQSARGRRVPAEVAEVGPDRHLVVDGIVAGDGGEPLQRGRAVPVQLEAVADHDVGLGKGGVDVPEVPHLIHDLVAAGSAGVQLRLIGVSGVLGVHDDGKRLVLDLDRVEGVLGDVAVLGRHDGHDLAGEASAVGGHVVPGSPLRIGRALLRLDEAQHVPAGDDAVDARDLQRVGIVDTLDEGVGVGTAQHGRVQHARQHDIVDVLAAAGEEAGILVALDRLSDPRPPLGSVLDLRSHWTTDPSLPSGRGLG